MQEEINEATPVQDVPETLAVETGNPDSSNEPTPPARTPGHPFFVFTINTVLALILLAGLAVLYYLHFTGSGSVPAVPMATMQKTAGKPISVVYVNIDSLNEKYEYVKHMRNDLEGTGQRLQKEVLSEQAALEKEAAEFQRQMAANIIPEEKAKAQYEQLMMRQQALLEKKERYTQQVAEKEMNMNLQLIDTVTAFLRRYNQVYRFDYIMGFKAGGEMLISNDSLDITRSVLDGLNQEFVNRKK